MDILRVDADALRGHERRQRRRGEPEYLPFSFLNPANLRKSSQRVETSGRFEELYMESLV